MLSHEEIYKNIDSPLILNAFYEGKILYDKEGVLKHNKAVLMIILKYIR